MDRSDRELAARCAAGETEALEALYRRYVDRVWRYGLMRSGTREGAAEIVQETFLRVARSIGGFKGRSSFGTWLFAVTRSAAVERSKRERRERDCANGVASLHLVADADDPPDPVEEAETKRAVREAVSRLPGGQRDAVVLCEFCGLSVREAAEALGWGRSRVKVTLFRARRRLRGMLSEYVIGQAVPQSGAC